MWLEPVVSNVDVGSCSFLFEADGSDMLVQFWRVLSALYLFFVVMPASIILHRHKNE